METKMSKRICSYLTNQNIINQNLEEVYIYGTEILLSFLFSTMIILTLGIALGQIPQTLVYLSVFIFLRRFTGGYHARTYLRCKVISVFAYLFVLFLANNISATPMLYFILIAFGLIVILLMGPIENPNKPLTLDERKKHKLSGLCLFLVIAVIGYLLVPLHNTLSSVIYFTLLSVIAFMLITLEKKGGKK